MTSETRSKINAAPAPDAPPIKIAIIEDQRDIREGLGTIFTFTVVEAAVLLTFAFLEETLD